MGVLSTTWFDWIDSGVYNYPRHRIVFTRLTKDVKLPVQFVLYLKLNSPGDLPGSKLYFSLVNIHSVPKDSNLNLSPDYLNINPDFIYLPFSVHIFPIMEENLIYINVGVKISVLPILNNRLLIIAPIMILYTTQDLICINRTTACQQQ